VEPSPVEPSVEETADPVLEPEQEPEAEPEGDSVIEQGDEPAVEPEGETPVEPSPVEPSAEETADPVSEPEKEPEAEPEGDSVIEQEEEPAVDPEAETPVEPSPVEPSVEETGDPAAAPEKEPETEPEGKPEGEPIIEQEEEPDAEPADEAPEEPLFQAGYALVADAQIPVKERPSGSSFTLTMLSRDDLVYVSERRLSGGEDRDRDWLFCHFDTAQGVVSGFARSAQLLPQTSPEQLAQVQARLDGGVSAARYEGKRLLLLDCQLLTAAGEEAQEPPGSTLEPEDKGLDTVDSLKPESPDSEGADPGDQEEPGLPMEDAPVQPRDQGSQAAADTSDPQEDTQQTDADVPAAPEHPEADQEQASEDLSQPAGADVPAQPAISEPLPADLSEPAADGPQEEAEGTEDPVASEAPSQDGTLEAGLQPAPEEEPLKSAGEGADPEHSEEEAGLLSLAALNTGEPDPAASEFTYTVQDGLVYITGYTGSSSHLEIPGEIDGMPVYSVKFYTWDGQVGSFNNTLYSLTLPASVKRIEGDAFTNYRKLASIKGLEHVEHVGVQAFTSSGLEAAVFSSKLRKIERSAFLGASISRLVIPDDVVLEDGALVSMYSLQSIELVTSGNPPRYQLQGGALLSADGGTLLHVPAMLNSASFTVPASVNTIGKRALTFRYGANIKQLIIPRTVTRILDGNEQLQWWIKTVQVCVYPGSYAEEFLRTYPDAWVSILEDDNPQATVGEKVQEVLAAVITPGMSEYQKALALHNWLVDHVAYDDSTPYYDAYHALMHGKAVCQGYMDALDALLKAAGIRCEQVLYLSIDHGFNLALLDGNWCYIDATWNDTLSTRAFFGTTDTMVAQVYEVIPVGGSQAAASVANHPEYRNKTHQAVIDRLKALVGARIADGETLFDIDMAEHPLSGGSNVFISCNVVAGALQTAAFPGPDGASWSVAATYDKATDQIRVVAFNPSQPIPEEFLVKFVEDGVSIAQYTGSDSEVVVPATMAGLPVVAIEEAAFANNRELLAVSLPEGLKRIGKGAFNGCEFLREINLPQSLTEIGDAAFNDCFSIEEMVFPRQITRIPDSCVNQGWGNYTKLKKVVFEGPVTYIGDAAFSNCRFLTEINLPDTVTYIGASAFNDCKNMAFSGLPAALEQLGPSAFGGVTTVTALHIPKSLTRIGEGLLNSNENMLQSITVAPGNPAYKARDNMLLTLDGFQLLAYAGANEATSCVIPDGVRSIEPNAFAHARFLKEIILPPSVSVIGQSAFTRCAALEAIVLPEAVTKLPHAVLHGCHSLRSVQVSSRLKSIDSVAFAESFALREISLPDSVTIIGDSCFFGAAVTAFTIPLGITVVNDSLFSRGKLAELTVHPYVTAISPGIFAEGTTPVVNGFPGTYAETFAKANGFTFVALAGEWPKRPEEPAPVDGDANDDGDVDEKDLEAVVEYLISGLPFASPENLGAEELDQVQIDNLMKIIDLLVGD